MSEKVKVELEFTPNPDSLKYGVNRILLARGSLNIADKETAKTQSGLAEALFEFPKIQSVMLGTNFLTVNLADQEGMNELNDRLIACIQSYIESGKPVVNTEAVSEETHSSGSLGEIETQIVRVLDEEIRPAVAMDGGDITFEKYEEGVVYVRMQGACSGCPSSLMTLKMGVETRLKEVVPEIQEVIPV